MDQNIALKTLLINLSFILPQLLTAQNREFPYPVHLDWQTLIWLVVIGLGIITLLLAFFLEKKVRRLFKNKSNKNDSNSRKQNRDRAFHFNTDQIHKVIEIINKRRLLILCILGFSYQRLFAQGNQGISIENILGQMPVVITIGLILIPVILAIIILFIRIGAQLGRYNRAEQK